MELFPLAEYWWFYLAFVVGVIVIVTLDLGVFHKKSHEISFREASAWTVAWITLALVFNVGLYYFALWKFQIDPRLISQSGFVPELAARQTAIEFLTGYVTEKALALDNIFVFAVLFRQFAVPLALQHRLLFFGLFGALIFRAILIALGSYLMALHAVMVAFGILLIFTGAKMLFSKDEGEGGESRTRRFLERHLRVHPQLEGEKFFVRRNGLLFATPLFVALLLIEISDVVFALDSVPAIFSLTREPLIVFTSNIFAILGLRSMYFMIAGALGRFAYIKYGLAGVLIFVGVKMTGVIVISIVVSLAVIVSLIAASIVVSLCVPPKPEK